MSKTVAIATSIYLQSFKSEVPVVAFYNNIPLDSPSYLSVEGAYDEEIKCTGVGLTPDFNGYVTQFTAVINKGSICPLSNGDYNVKVITTDSETNEVIMSLPATFTINNNQPNEVYCLSTYNCLNVANKNINYLKAFSFALGVAIVGFTMIFVIQKALNYTIGKFT